MHRHKTWLALVAATLMLVAVSNASANRLSMSSRTFRITWASLEFENNINSNTVRCPVTLEGSYHSATFTKTTGALIGYITRASLNGPGCTGGRATVLTESLPWHLRYKSFSGTLPSISGIEEDVIGESFQIETGGVTCSETSEVIHPWRIIRGIIRILQGIIEVIRGLSEARIPLRGGLCGFGEGDIRGEGTPTVPGSTTQITVSLI